MRFLSKIRERQFTKKWGGAYNLSRAVLAGVLAAGCLMPGFAEAASFNMDDGVEGIDYTEDGNIATIIKDISGVGTRDIYWNPATGEGCTIIVNNRNIEPGIYIYGGKSSGVVTGNTVTIKDTTFKNDSETSFIYGGTSESSGGVTGNKVEISGNTKFEGDSEIYGGFTSSIGDVTGNRVEISDKTTFEGDSYISGGESQGGKAENNTVEISGNTTFTLASEIYGGYTGSNGTVTGNRVEISGNTTFAFGSTSKIYGGYSVDGQANGNSVSISGGTIKGDVWGGFGKTANGNSVIISGSTSTIKGEVLGGYPLNGTANGNSVIISGGTIYGNVFGGLALSNSSEAHDNKVILVGEYAKYPLSTEQTINGSDHININGAVYGGTHSGNEIHVYGSKINVGHIAGFNTLRFFIDDTMTFGETMLTIKGVTNSSNITFSNVTISKDNLAVKVTGKPKASGDNNTITLIHNESDKIKYSDNITLVPVEIGRLLTGEGSVALVPNENDKEDLVLTLNVEKSTVNENGKSLVETRAAAAFVVNNMSDFMLGTGMEQAKAAAGGVTPIDEGKLTPFAAVGGSNMRYTTGSYVDVNGWNGAVGFAKQADKLLFGVAVEHGRGNYDSYLDSGVHASGDIKSTGGVIFGEYKLDNGVHYDAALRAGRVKSDYSSTATSYDESSAYYGFSLGGGKELTVSDKATLDVYGRYYFSHTNGSDVSIATGEEIDFDAVNSHRLRIGGRYTTTLTEKSKAYAGLAWQYEFGGDAKAAINGYSAPTPSLQGHSAIVEAGYKLNAGKNLTLDFNLNGAMGKQRGIGGGIGAQWLF